MKHLTILLLGLHAFIFSSAQVNVSATLGTPTASYTTLKACFDAVNAGTHQGVVTVVLSASTTETASAVLNASGSGSASYTSLSIYPDISGVVVSGNLAGPLVDLNGADNVTLDGRVNATGSTRDLVLSNSNTGGSVIELINDASTNSIKYCLLQGVNSSTTGGVVLFGTTTATTGNDNNTIDNCAISDGATTPVNGVYALGTSAKENNGNTVSNCDIYNFYSSATAANGGTGILISSNNTAWTITGNSFYQTADRSTFTNDAVLSAVYINNTSGNGFSVQGNYIGGKATACGSTAMTINSSNQVLFQGIYINVGFTTTTVVDGNTIRNLAFTTAKGVTHPTAAWTGIYIASGKVDAGPSAGTGNIIGAATGTGSITVTGSATTTSMGIYCASTSANINLYKNVIGSITLTGTSATLVHHFYGIYLNGASTKTYTVASNKIGSSSTAASIQSFNSTNTALAQILCGMYNASNNYGATILFTGNEVYNLTNYTTNTAMYYFSQVIGIYSNSGATTISGNTVRNLTNAGGSISCTNIGYGGLYDAAIGIMYSGSAASTVSGNQIYNLSTGAASGVTGLAFSSYGNNIVEKNLIHSLSAASGAAVRGIFGQNGYTIYRNNMLRLGLDENGTSITTPVTFTGIVDYTGNLSAYNSFYNNTVYIGGTGVTNTANTYAFLGYVLINTRYVKNNIFVNNRSFSSASGSVFNYAYANSGYLPMPYGLYSDYNLFYANGTGAKLFYNTTRNIGYATLAAWRSGTVTADLNSYVADPNFINATGDAASFNLRLQSPSPAEASGVVVASVTDDFDGYTRSSLTPVDLGASAANLTLVDNKAPIISFTPVTSTASTTNLTLTNFATITDNAGVSTGASLPRIYYKKRTDADAFGGNTSADNGWKYVSASNSSSPFSFTIDYSIINGGSITAGDVIEYFVAAQDDANNLASLPYDATASGTPVVQTVNSKPGFSIPYSYAIRSTISGAVTVGTAGTYPTLTGTGGLFEAINFGTVTGNITASIISDITEPGTVALNQWTESGAGNYTFTIQPDGTTLRTISSTIVATYQPMIPIDGADRVIINGGNKYLLFRNNHTYSSAATGPTLQVTGGSTSITITNCTFESATTSNFMANVYIGATGTNAVTLSTNDFRNPSNAPYNTILTSTQIFSGSLTNSLTITDNNIYNIEGPAYYAGYGIKLDNVANGCVITGNSFYHNSATLPNGGSSGLTMIYFASSQNYGHTISNNYIGGSSSGCGGTAFLYNSSSPAFQGIYLSTGTTTATNINGNIIKNFRANNASASFSFTGISLQGGSFNVGTVSGNQIGDPSVANSIQLSNCSFSGIVNAYRVTSLIENNIIANITNTYSTATNGLTAINTALGTVNKNRIFAIGSSAAGSTSKVTGISIGYSDLSNTIVVSNNQVSLNGGSATNAIVRGIEFSSVSGSNTANIYYNTVYIYGAVTNSNSACLYKAAATRATTYKNNLLLNARTTSGSGINYAIENAGTVLTGWSSDYNVMVTTDASNVVRYNNTNYTFSAWRTASSGDASSWFTLSTGITIANLFTNTATGDLSVLAANTEGWLVKGKGLPISGYSTDYSGNTRSVTVAGGAPCIGATEFTPAVAPAAITVTPLAGGSNTFTLNGRDLATITWGAGGTVPTSVSLKYYSGTNPLEWTRTYKGNFYYVIEATGGTGYSYDILLYYDHALIGNITSESAIVMSKRPTGAGAWTFPGSSDNAVSNSVSATGLSSFSEFTITDDASLLPVEFIELKAVYRNQQVELGWITMNETNTAYAELQRSADGRNFEPIVRIQAAGNSDARQYYSYNDKLAVPGVNIYRVRMIDADSTFRYSNVATVKISETPALFIYSNPVSDGQFRIRCSRNVQVTVYDLTGTVMFRQQLNAGAYVIPVASWHKGLYYLKGESEVIPVVLQ